jgi:eukaryotic-like serine/threonine-protein kinase
MGEVWLAEDSRLKRKVALKLLSAVHKKELLARFEQEAHAISSLNHPNIITIFDIGQSGGWEYIATEYIQGKTLRQLIGANSLDTTQAVKIATQIAAALAAAHSAGIVHRDIKPENIMIRADGIAKVLDFGLARFSDENIASLNEKLKTAPGMVMGTVTYMSPEQARGHSVNDKTDVFSLGIVFYEMLTGKQPFEGESGMDVLAAILKYEPQQLDESFPIQLRNIIDKSLVKNPAERPAAAEILSELRGISRNEDFSVETGKLLIDNKPDNQTVGVTALTDKNPRRKTGNFVATQKAGQPIVYKIAAGFILLLALIASGFAFYSYRAKSPAAVILTENDSLLVADFENKTGDKDFDDKVFDQTIFTSLRQSPYITTTSYNDVAEKLKEIGITPPAPITNDIAKEIGRRLGGKAFLKGSIENKDSKYLITFEAVNPETGESLAKEQSEADNKDGIVDALDTALTKMRGRLGEPEEIVKKFSVPISSSASSSITALKLNELAARTEYEDKHDDAVVLYKRAIEADPNYVIPYYSLASTYSDRGQETAAKAYLEKAFALRDRLTERDKPEITNFYYSYVTGEIDKGIESYEITKKEYPRDFTIPINLGESYLTIGDLTRAEENFRTALKIAPKMITPRNNLGETLIKQSRFEQAKNIYQESVTLGGEDSQTRPGLFKVAFVFNNEGEMQRQLDVLKETDETGVLVLEASRLIYAGKANEYAQIMNQVIDRAAKETPEIAGQYAVQAATNFAAFGKCREAKTWANRALDYNREQAILTNAALVSAVCDAKPEALIIELENKFPQHFLVKNIWLPIIRAAVEMKTSPEKALETLEANRQYEAATAFWGNYLRGKIYLKLSKPELAAKEFQKILENRGWAVESPLYALAHLGLARAAELQNDAANAKIHSSQFAALWKNADKNLPVLKEVSAK